MDRQMRLNRSVFWNCGAGIHGPVHWSVFLKRDAEIHGPPNWSVFFKDDGRSWAVFHLFVRNSGYRNDVWIFQMNAMHDLKCDITVKIHFQNWPFSSINHFINPLRSFHPDVLVLTYHLERTEVPFAPWSGLGLGNHLHWTRQYCSKPSAHTHCQVTHFRSVP